MSDASWIVLLKFMLISYLSFLPTSKMTKNIALQCRILWHPVYLSAIVDKFVAVSVWILNCFVMLALIG